MIKKNILKDLISQRQRMLFSKIKAKEPWPQKYNSFRMLLGWLVTTIKPMGGCSYASTMPGKRLSKCPCPVEQSESCFAYRGVRPFSVSGPHWKKKSCLEPCIKYAATHNHTKKSCNILSKFMILCWATFIAILGHREPQVGHSARAYSDKWQHTHKCSQESGPDPQQGLGNTQGRTTAGPQGNRMRNHTRPA